MRSLPADIHAETILDATRLPGTPQPEELREAARAAAEALDADPLGTISDPAEDSHPPERGRALGPRPAAIGEKVPALVAAGPAAGRPRQSGGGRHSPRRAEFWAPRERAAEAATALREEVHGLVDRLQAALGIEDRRAAALARGPAGLGPPDAAGIVDGRGAAALRPAKGLRRSGADDLHGRRHAVGLVAGAAADPPRVAQPAPGARRAAPPQRPAAAAFRADLGTAAAATRGSPGRGHQDGRRPSPRELSPQDRRHARRSRPAAAEPRGSRLAQEAGRGTARPDRGAGISHPGRGPRRRFAQPSQAARLRRSRRLLPRRRRAAAEPPPGRGLGRRLRAGRFLPALDPAIQSSGLRHVPGPLPDEVPGDSLRRGRRDPDRRRAPRAHGDGQRGVLRADVERLDKLRADAAGRHRPLRTDPRPAVPRGMLGVAQACRPDAAAGLFRFVPLVLRLAAGATDPGQPGRPVPLPLRLQAAGADAHRLASSAAAAGQLAD